MTRAASLILRVIGLALVLVAIMGFVLVGVDGTWTARTQVPAGRTAVLLEPSVVSVLGPSVTVRVEPADGTSGADLFLGRGRSDDLTAYAQDANVSRVVGLTRSRELDVREGPGPVATLPQSSLPTASTTAAPSAPAARGRPPAAVDLWEQVSGPGAHELSWRPTPGAQSVLVAAEDAAPLPALDVEVAWTDHSWLWIPSVVLVLGIALLVAGVVVNGGLSRLPVPFSLPPSLRLARPRRLTEGRRPRVLDRAIATEPAPDPAGASPPEPAPEPDSASHSAPEAPDATPDPTPDVMPEPRAVDVSADVVPATRRAARGRRRKQTMWNRARSKVRAVAPADDGGQWSHRGVDEADRRGLEGERS
jgi:hypothetical protein